MPSLDRAILFGKLRAALPPKTTFSSSDETTPAEVDIPDFGKAILYLWTLTPDRSETGARPAGEYKIQLIVSNQKRGEPASFMRSGSAFTAALGFSPDFGVFCGWQASLYPEFAYSRNVQAREDLLAAARDSGWAVDEPRKLRTGQEVRVAFSAGNLLRFLRLSKEADRDGLSGSERESFFLSHGDAFPQDATPVEETVRERLRIATMRLARNAKFGPGVKKAYAFGCAVCKTQLDIVEGAHIIPASEKGSSDDVWNGIALCPNHHTLFDARLLIVRDDLTVGVDEPILDFLQKDGRARGAETLLWAYKDATIAKPSFWKDLNLRKKMEDALRRRLARSGQS